MYRSNCTIQKNIVLHLFIFVSGNFAVFSEGYRIRRILNGVEKVKTYNMKGRERYQRQTTFRVLVFLQLKTTVCTFWMKETPYRKQRS